jgi:hypothetical protein
VDLRVERVGHEVEQVGGGRFAVEFGEKSVGPAAYGRAEVSKGGAGVLEKRSRRALRALAEHQPAG